MAKASNHLGLHGYVLDTIFGPRYDVTKPFVLTRIRQDVSAGRCVAGVISPPRQHTSCCSKVMSASASTANLPHRARMPWILEHPCYSWFWDVPKIQTDSCGTASHGPGLGGFFRFWITMQKTNVISGWVSTAEMRTVLLASVLDRWTLQCFSTKTFSSQGFCITL